MKTTFSLLLALLVSGCASRKPAITTAQLEASVNPRKAVTIRGRDNRAIVALKPKGTLTVELNSNTGAGYHWKLAEPLDPKVIVLVSRSGNPLPPIALAPDEVTRPLPEQWVFKAVGPGVTRVRMLYLRPDEPLDKVVTYEFSVRAE